MNKLWRWFLPGYLIALPCALVGIIMGIIMRGRWVWEKGLPTVYVKSIPGGNIAAQTWGWLILKNYKTVGDIVDVHERVHVVQFFLLGPLFWLVYGADYAYQRLRGLSHWPAYYQIRLEKQAYRLQNNVGAWGDDA